MSYRAIWEERETTFLSPHATLSKNSRGRKRPEDPCSIRTNFQIDRERIVNSKAFRRLKHKTQVFLSPAGDHYRTRLTHTLEVTEIARTIARCLRINEDLTEAVSLGHDLGHTPFGHAGERVLGSVHPGGFHHMVQSIRVIEVLENDGQGLNLTHEVLEGIAKHSKGKSAAIVPPASFGLECSLEALVVRISDVTAYVNHDLDDSIRAGILKPSDVPAAVTKILGPTRIDRVNRIINSVVSETAKADDGHLHIEPDVVEQLNVLRAFLFENVYETERVLSMFKRCGHIIRELYTYFVENPDVLRRYHRDSADANVGQAACDFIAGMTDNYILQVYEDLLMPKRWSF